MPIKLLTSEDNRKGITLKKEAISKDFRILLMNSWPIMKFKKMKKTYCRITNIKQIRLSIAALGHPYFRHRIQDKNITIMQKDSILSFKAGPAVNQWRKVNFRVYLQEKTTLEAT